MSTRETNFSNILTSESGSTKKQIEIPEFEILFEKFEKELVELRNLSNNILSQVLTFTGEEESKSCCEEMNERCGILGKFDVLIRQIGYSNITLREVNKNLTRLIG